VPSLVPATLFQSDARAAAVAFDQIVTLPAHLRVSPRSTPLPALPVLPTLSLHALTWSYSEADDKGVLEHRTCSMDFLEDETGIVETKTMARPDLTSGTALAESNI